MYKEGKRRVTSVKNGSKIVSHIYSITQKYIDRGEGPTLREFLSGL